MSKVSIVFPYYNRMDLLVNTLRSFEEIYLENCLEIVIVDDGSDEKLDVKTLGTNLDINVINLPKNKKDINPCYPYNVGVRNSTGDVIVLSSPETMHTTNMFEISNNFEGIEDSYLLFSVFCLTDKTIDIRNVDTSLFLENVGSEGYSYANKYGSWYLHSKYRNSGLNFLSAISREKYYELSGFDERYRYGTGFDDTEFRDRVYRMFDNIIYFDNANAIHQDHEVVNNMQPTTNQELYNKQLPYNNNDNWGKL
jgi:glycosyltransferase involved in cell wall biosynthesis